MKLLPIHVLAVFAMTAVAAADEENFSSYLCIPEEIVGIEHSDDNWQGIAYSGTDRKLILRRSNGGPGIAIGTYYVNIFGESLDVARICRDPMFMGKPTSQLECGIVGNTFIINLDNMRYMFVSYGSYLHDKPYPYLPNTMEIGKCDVISG